MLSQFIVRADFTVKAADADAAKAAVDDILDTFVTPILLSSQDWEIGPDAATEIGDDLDVNVLTNQNLDRATKMAEAIGTALIEDGYNVRSVDINDGEQFWINPNFEMVLEGKHRRDMEAI